MTPQTEWPAVARESDDAQVSPHQALPHQAQPQKVLRYIAILALIPALARLVGGWLIGGYTPLVAALIGAALAYALSFAVVFAVALVVDLLAPKFGGERSYPNALRLTAYSFTPLWLVGIVLLVPGASFLVLLGLYGVYLMWLGLPLLMRSSQDKTLPYIVTVALWAIALEAAARFALITTIGAIR